MSARSRLLRASPITYLTLFALAPGQQLFPAKPRVGAHDNAHSGPLGPQPGDDPLDFFDAARGGVLIRGALPRGQQVRPCEDVQRQVAVAAIVAVEEASFLFAVQRRVGRVEIENHLLGRFLMRFDKRLEQQLVDALELAADLRVAVGAVGCALEPIQGGLAGQRLAAVPLTLAIFSLQVTLAGQQRQHGVVAQLVVVVEIFVAQRDGVDALLDQLGDAVLDAFGITMIFKAAGQSFEQTQPPLDLAQQHCSALGADLAAVETRRHLASEMLAETEFELLARTVTLCGHGLFPPSGPNALSLKRLCHRKRPVFYFIVIFPG